MKFSISIFEVLFLMFGFGVIMSIIHSKMKETVETWKDHMGFGLTWMLMVNLTMVFVIIVHVVGVWIFSPIH